MFKFALIYPPYQSSFIEYDPGIKAVKSNYGVIPCLSLLYVAGILKDIKCNVKFFDVEALRLNKEQLKGHLLDFRPDYVGFTLTTYLFHHTLDLVRFVKSFLNVPVIVGGVHLGIYPEETFRAKEIDYGIIGEAEETLPELVEALKTGKDLSMVKGICFRRNGRLVITEQRPLLKNIDSAPIPARDLIPNERYYTFVSQRKNFTSIISSRGCPFKCIYCEQGRLPFRARSPKNVVDEMEECHKRYGVREFDFFDSSFTIQEDRVIEICDEIRSRGLKVYWSVRSRVDTVNEKMLESMAKGGCVRIYYGIESGNSKVLRTLRKEANLTKIKEVIRLTKRRGINTFGFFMIGCPGETESTIRKTINFAKGLDLEYAQFSNVTPFPHTELYEMFLEEYNYDYWREFILNRNTPLRLQKPRTLLTNEQIKKAIRKAYLEFYLRPGYIMKISRKVKSIEELKRYMKAMWDMIREG